MGSRNSVYSETVETESQAAVNRKRRGTGRWSATSNNRVSGTTAEEVSEPAHDTSGRDSAAGINRKRGGTGRWQQRAPSTGAKSLEEGAAFVAESTTEDSDATEAHSEDSGRSRNSEGSGDSGATESTVLSDAIALAEAAWNDLADFRECSIEDIAHDSQLVTDEGEETRVPSWRMDQIVDKKEEAKLMMTKRQRRRKMKFDKKLASQQRQIQKLIANYFPIDEC